MSQSSWPAFSAAAVDATAAAAPAAASAPAPATAAADCGGFLKSRNVRTLWFAQVTGKSRAKPLDSPKTQLWSEIRAVVQVTCLSRPGQTSRAVTMDADGITKRASMNTWPGDGHHILV